MLKFNSWQSLFFFRISQSLKIVSSIHKNTPRMIIFINFFEWLCHQLIVFIPWNLKQFWIIIRSNNFITYQFLWHLILVKRNRKPFNLSVSHGWHLRCLSFDQLLFSFPHGRIQLATVVRCNSIIVNQI